MCLIDLLTNDNDDSSQICHRDRFGLSEVTDSINISSRHLST